MGQAFIASDKKGRLKILISSFQTTFWFFQGMGFNRISLIYLITIRIHPLLRFILNRLHFLADGVAADGYGQIVFGR